MYKNKQAQIIELLQKNKYMAVNEISEQLNISPSTIRRELTALEKKNLAIRTHGGVRLADSNNYTPDFALRIHQNVLEKKIIDLKALKLIKDGDVIFLDGSTSAYFIAEYLSEFSNLTVITNGIDTLSLLAHNNVTTYSTGGCVSKENSSVLVGEQTLESIKNIHANIAFFSCQALSRDGKIYDCYLQENYVRKQMMKNSDKTVFLCDSNKLDKLSSYYLCDLNEVDILVTNKDVTDYFNKKITTQIIF
ncbi:MAG: DeoR/GlpR transcriptional regulator [Clostridiales bacterium]|nr:DeoR/GlpR transcriptional regulator [Clostridiales bacterium]